MKKLTASYEQMTPREKTEDLIRNNPFFSSEFGDYKNNPVAPPEEVYDDQISDYVRSEALDFIQPKKER